MWQKVVKGFLAQPHCDPDPDQHLSTVGWMDVALKGPKWNLFLQSLVGRNQTELQGALTSTPLNTFKTKWNADCEPGQRLASEVWWKAFQEERRLSEQHINVRGWGGWDFQLCVMFWYPHTFYILQYHCWHLPGRQNKPNKKKERWHAVTKQTVPQMAPSSERSAQSTLPLQILSGVRHAEVSLAQGYFGGLHTADSQDSSSERSSQSMSPSHTQLFVIHLPAGIETYRQRGI